MRGNDDVDEKLDELVELGAKPSLVDDVSVVVTITARAVLVFVGGRRREGWEEGSEEGLEREERFDDVLRRRVGRDEGEEERKVIYVGPR